MLISEFNSQKARLIFTDYSVFIYIYMYVRVSMYIYIYIYMCVCINHVRLKKYMDSVKIGKRFCSREARPGPKEA